MCVWFHGDKKKNQNSEWGELSSAPHKGGALGPGTWNSHLQQLFHNFRNLALPAVNPTESQNFWGFLWPITQPRALSVFVKRSKVLKDKFSKICKMMAVLGRATEELRDGQNPCSSITPWTPPGMGTPNLPGQLLQCLFHGKISFFIPLPTKHELSLSLTCYVSAPKAVLGFLSVLCPDFSFHTTEFVELLLPVKLLIPGLSAQPWHQ